MSKKPVPGSFTRYDSSAQYAPGIRDLPLPASAVPVDQPVNELDTESLTQYIKRLERDIGFLTYKLGKSRSSKSSINYSDYYETEIKKLKGELEDAKSDLEKLSKVKTTDSGLKPVEPGASAFFKGVKTAGKGTRRRKQRKHKKWTSSATRKRSSMSASMGRRGRK